MHLQVGDFCYNIISSFSIMCPSSMLVVGALKGGGNEEIDPFDDDRGHIGSSGRNPDDQTGDQVGIWQAGPGSPSRFSQP